MAWWIPLLINAGVQGIRGAVNISGAKKKNKGKEVGKMFANMALMGAGDTIINAAEAAKKKKEKDIANTIESGAQTAGNLGSTIAGAAGSAGGAEGAAESAADAAGSAATKADYIRSKLQDPGAAAMKQGGGMQGILDQLRKRQQFRRGI